MNHSDKKRTREDYEFEKDNEKIKKLIGNDKALLEAINKNQDDIVIGIINPSGEEDTKITTYYTKSELKALVKDFYNKKTIDSSYSIPLYTEHNTSGKEWGKIVFLGLSKAKGTLWMLASINGTPEGNKAREEIQNGNMRCLSMGFDIQFKEDKKEGVLPVAKTLKEVSLCRKGDREGTDIKTICSLRSLLLNKDILNKKFKDQTKTENTTTTMNSASGSGTTMQQLLYSSKGTSMAKPQNIIDESFIRRIPDDSVSFEDMCSSMTANMESSMEEQNSNGTFGSSATASATDAPGENGAAQQQQESNGMEVEQPQAEPAKSQESDTLSKLKSLLEQNKAEQAKIQNEIEEAENSLKLLNTQQQNKQQKPVERVTLSVPYKPSPQPEPPEEEYINSIQNNPNLSAEQKDKYIKKAYDAYNRDKIIWEKEEAERQKSFDQGLSKFADIVHTLRSNGDNTISNEDATQLAQSLLKDGVNPATNTVLNSMGSFIGSSNASASVLSSEEALLKSHIKKLREEFAGCQRRSSEIEQIFLEQRQIFQEASEKLKKTEEENKRLKSHIPIGTEDSYVSSSVASNNSGTRRMVQAPQNGIRKVVTSVGSTKRSAYTLPANATQLQKEMFVASKYAMLKNIRAIQKDGDPRNEIPEEVADITGLTWAMLGSSAFLEGDQEYDIFSHPPIRKAWEEQRKNNGLPLG